MSVLLTREMVEQQVTKVISELTAFSPEKNEVLKKNVNVNNIMKFFLGVSREDVKKLYDTIGTMQPTSMGETVIFIEHIVTRNLLDMVFHSIRQMEEVNTNLSSDQKIDFLIDLKSKANADGSEIIIRDTLEDDLK